MTTARRVAAGLAAAASVTAIVGSALPLFTTRIDAGAVPVEITFTPWDVEVTGGFPLGEPPANGYPLVVAAFVLAFAAIRCRLAASPAASPRSDRVAGVVTAVGGAFLACAVWMVVLQAISWEDAYGPPDDTDVFTFAAQSSYLAGLWVLVVAAVLGVAAAVPALLPGRQPEPVADVDPDAPTPPYGIVLPAEVEEPPPPVADDEAPRLGPVVIPDAPPPPASPPGPAVPPVEDPLDEPRRH